MFELFYMGGPLFMSILTILATVMLVLAGVNGWTIFSNISNDTTIHRLSLIKDVGVLALVCGVLGTSIGLFSAFGAIEAVGDISVGMMAGGLKVAMITLIYGFFIYILSMIIWLLLNWKLSQN